MLGRGGLGTVFRAQHIGSLMAVALKLLHPRFAARDEYRRSLLPEARRAATVAHQRCARLLDVGEAEDGQTYLAMELVEGRTLDGLWRSGPLAPAHAVAILLQVAEALVAIHAAELVHCDLSPRNVMVAADEGRLCVKVLDFGIARSMHLVRPGPGELAGFVNPAFSAPELLAGQDVDPRADLFSLGTIGWLLITGSLPVDDPAPRGAAGRRPWPGPAGVPRRLVRLLQDCLQHDPGRRPASAALVAGELAAIAAARRPFASRLAVTLAVLATGLSFVARGSGQARSCRSGPVRRCRWPKWRPAHRRRCSTCRAASWRPSAAISAASPRGRCASSCRATGTCCCGSRCSPRSTLPTGRWCCPMRRRSGATCWWRCSSCPTTVRWT